MRQHIFGRRISNKDFKNNYSDAIENKPENSEVNQSVAEYYGFQKTKKSDEIDFQICGDSAQYVVIELDQHESIIADPGTMICMETGIDMQTIFGDASQDNTGIWGALKGAGKRILSGEGAFTTVFTNLSHKKRKITLACEYPGDIIPVDLSAENGELICQKGAFLCAAKGVSIDIAFQKKFSTAFFGGEGFVMQRLSGDGMVFIHAGGNMMSIDLDDNETIRVDAGCIVAYQPTIECDIQFTGGIKSTLFGGEGLFITTLSGKGRIWLQTMPINRLRAQLTHSSISDEGSVAGGVGRAAVVGSGILASVIGLTSNS